MRVTPRLADLTTLRLGGPAAQYMEATSEEDVVDAVLAADADEQPLLVLAGGSNVVVADEGFPGVVVRLATRGVERRTQDGKVFLTVQAGESWDDLVARCVAEGLSGIEALSGIPGSVGATPIQNVGAYGQEVAETIDAILVLDRKRKVVELLDQLDGEFSYRSSVFKRTPDRWVVLAVVLALDPDPLSRPVRYAELASRLGIAPGERAPLADVREAVLDLRRGKGMVIDPDDPDSVSAGSFFTNPVLTAEAFEDLRARVHEKLGPAAEPPGWPEAGGCVKTSAAWLIERAGFSKGHGDPATVAISGKHTLALTNRGAGTTEQLVALAREVAGGVRGAFGVDLVPEPVFVGHTWEPAPR
jgi:UDP-N-acetylmuramate dehydrogenase